jgi:hypothetical protein
MSPPTNRTPTIGRELALQLCFTVTALVAGCAREPAALPDPVPMGAHAEAAAAAAKRVGDPARGGPAVHPSASPLPPFLGVDRGSARYVGARHCGQCHPGAVSVWESSAHADSLAVLVDAQRSHDPRCLRCHVTGLGHPGGSGEATGLAEVGCEACHGPGSDHVQAPGVGGYYGSLPADGSACVGCHTHDNSPAFRWESHWPLVAHERSGR